MLSHYRAIREAGRRIAAATDRAVVALREGRVEQEPALTDRMLGAIEESLQGASTHGVRWGAKTLTDHGKGSQESKYGADFMGVLDINLPDYKVTKGFLAQAKLIRNSRPIDLKDLKDQCERMLKLSPASFVFLYSTDGIQVVPAVSVLAAEKQPTELYGRSAGRFFEEHLECFLGDRAISSPKPDTFDVLRLKYEARAALVLNASEAFAEPMMA